MNLLKPKDRAYLDWLRTQPCLFTGDPETEPAHIGTGGKGLKHAYPVDTHAYNHYIQGGRPMGGRFWELTT